MTLKEKLDAIRKAVDMAVADDIDSIIGKGVTLNGVVGLAAECKGQAKKELELARLEALAVLSDKGYAPSVLTKAIDMHCSTELARYEYSDRLNAAISHQLDFLRSTLSYRKEEMRNQLNGVG